MASIRRRKFNGLDFLLLIVFASEETCGNINGQTLCYFKAWDYGVNWDTAWDLCSSRNASLPAIRNRNEQDVFEKFLTMHSSGSVWTSGRNYTYDNWTWLDGQQLSDRGRRHLFSSHQRYQPVLYLGFGIVDDRNPRAFLTYICEYSGDLCNYVNYTANVTNGCITYSDDTRSWYDARNQCLMTGGDLAVLEDYDQEHHDGYMTRRYRVRWIGLRKTSWRWNLNKNASEEDEIKYTNWSEDWNPLIGDCISIDGLNGTWRTTECSDKLKVVCQTDFVSMTTSKSDSSLFLAADQESPSVGYPTFISVVIVGICVIVISNIIVALVVRKYIYHRSSLVASSSETTENRRYQDLETTQRQLIPDGPYAELQLQPLYEEVGRRGK